MAKQKKFALKVTQASLNQTAMDFPRNLANIYEAVRLAVEAKSDILALEELALTGYEANDDFQKTDNTLIYAHLKDIAAYAAALDPHLVISIGHPWRLNKRDLGAVPGLESERLNNPMFNRTDLPFNVQSFLSGGQIQAMTAKMFLFNDERGYEKRYFQEWSMQAANEIGGVFGTIPLEIDGRVIPFGRPVVEIRDDARNLRLNLSHVICEERWAATRFGGAPYNDDRYEQDGVAPAISRYVGGGDGLVLIMPNASPPARLKIDKHVHLVKLASQYANAVVDTDGLGSSGSTFVQFGHRLVAQDNKLLSHGERMNFGRVATTTTTIAVKSAALKSASHVALAHDFKNAAGRPLGTIAKGWDNPANPDRHAEEVLRMTALWLFDQMRKTKSQGIAEALSGGADSAFNCVMVAAMVRLAVADLGVDGFCREMVHLHCNDDMREAAKTGGDEAAIQTCLQYMLTTIYMGTNNSSAETYNAAKFLIEGDAATPGIGGKFISRNVQDLLNIYAVNFAVQDASSIPPARKAALVDAVSTYLNQGRGTSPSELAVQAAAIKAQFPEIETLISAADPRYNVAYENIQARVRQVLVMLVANVENKMAIANPNLDEARNAYATFGGDLHSGTINLNAHLPKGYQLQLMRYLCDKGLSGVMPPVKSLSLILKNKPSAELQPKGANGAVVQTDEDDLQRSFAQMDFISQKMLYARIATPDGLRRLNAGEVFDFCTKDAAFTGVSENALYNMVRLSYKRWSISQHKIHASPIAPTFGMNVDHQTSLRTPNFSGGSADELAVLGVRLIGLWAKAEGVAIAGFDPVMALRRARQDENFIKVFEDGVRNKNPALKMDSDLKTLYGELKKKGWNSIFPPLPPTHPLMVIR
ncbi:MAG: nitrilase-related carbon-nitrogen hydrolase [Micavibrio sp.]